VGTGISQQPALKGRNPAIDSMMPFQGYGKEIAFIHKALPNVVNLRVETGVHLTSLSFVTKCRIRNPKD
jgi:hypothetical protein